MALPNTHQSSTPSSSAPLVQANAGVVDGRRTGGTPGSVPVFSLRRGPASACSSVRSARETETGSPHYVADQSAARPDVLLLGRRESAIRANAPPPLRPRVVVGSLATRIYAYYRSKGDAQQTRPIFNSATGSQPSKFNNATLRKARLFALSTGRDGLSVAGKKMLWDVVVSAERSTRASDAAGGMGPMESAFESAAKFAASFKSEENRCLTDQGWRETKIVIDGQAFTFYWRDLWDVAVEAIVGAAERSMYGHRRVRGDGSIIRSGTLDSDLYLEEQARVFKEHKINSNEKQFVLATQLFSDAALVSWSGGTLIMFIFRAYSNICTLVFAYARMDRLVAAMHTCAR